MKTPAKINASRDESGKMLIGLDGTGAGLLLLAGRIASGVLVTVASNEKEMAELKNVMRPVPSGRRTCPTLPTAGLPTVAARSWTT